jgi:hypothetical protein
MQLVAIIMGNLLCSVLIRTFYIFAMVNETDQQENIRKTEKKEQRKYSFDQSDLQTDLGENDWI